MLSKIIESEVKFKMGEYIDKVIGCVICTNNKNLEEYLEVGKVYDVYCVYCEQGINYHIIIDEQGEKCGYEVCNFSELREKDIEGNIDTMKVKCINEDRFEYITKGVTYNVFSDKGEVYTILDDNDELHYYPKTLFIPTQKEQNDKKKEMVEHPSHYNQGKYEVIDVIEDWNLGFSLGNAVKYIARAGHKWNAVEDLKKAIFYIQYEINKKEREEV